MPNTNEILKTVKTIIVFPLAKAVYQDIVAINEINTGTINLNKEIFFLFIYNTFIVLGLKINKKTTPNKNNKKEYPYILSR